VALDGVSGRVSLRSSGGGTCGRGFIVDEGGEDASVGGSETRGTMVAGV